MSYDVITAKSFYVTFKHIPQPIRRHLQIFRTLMTTFENLPHCLTKYSIVQGEGDVPKFLGDWNHNIFVN